MTPLFLLQLVHTLVFAVCIATLGPLGWYALSGQGQTLALWALLPPIGIFVGLQLNGGRCILQTLARRWSGVAEDDPRWVRDILFLPESWAVRVVRIMLPVFVITVGAAGVRFGIHSIGLA